MDGIIGGHEEEFWSRQLATASEVDRIASSSEEEAFVGNEQERWGTRAREP